MDRNELARVALGVFMDCSGFDGWWEGIDEETQADILDELDKGLAAAALRQSAWRPMSAAPRDGTEVWTFNGEQRRMRFWSMPEWSGWCWADDVLNDVDPSPEQPTAWQPLLPPPADEVICNR